jgi:hypothetical protein
MEQGGEIADPCRALTVITSTSAFRWWTPQGLHPLSCSRERGAVIGVCRRRKRQVEFIELLDKIDRDTPDSVTDINLICDSVSTHQPEAKHIEGG